MQTGGRWWPWRRAQGGTCGLAFTVCSCWQAGAWPRLRGRGPRRQPLPREEIPSSLHLPLLPLLLGSSPSPQHPPCGRAPRTPSSPRSTSGARCCTREPRGAEGASPQGAPPPPLLLPPLLLRGAEKLLPPVLDNTAPPLLFSGTPSPTSATQTSCSEGSTSRSRACGWPTAEPTGSPRRTEALAAADAAATRGVAGSGSSGGDWALAAFAPLGLLRFRAAVAGPDRPRVAWPSLFADAERGKAANAAALSLWSRSLPAVLRASGTAACSSRSFVSDVAPALLRVASAPGTRPVAHHLLSKTEKESLEAAVATLASYNLTYSPRTAKDSFGGSFVPFSKKDSFGNNSNAGAPLAVGGPAAAFAAAFAAAAESGAYGGSMMMMASNQQQRQPSTALSSASSLASAGSLASASSGSLPFGAAGPSAPLKEGDLDLFPTVISDVVSFGLGRARPGAALPQPVRALLASEVAQEVIRRREAAFTDKAGPPAAQQLPNATAAAAAAAKGDRRASSSLGGTAAAPVPLTLAERAAQSGAAARAAMAAQQERERKGTWLDQIRGQASKRRAGVLAAAAVRAAASVAETQERQMAASAVIGCGGGKEGTASANNAEELSPGEMARKAALPKAVYRFNEGYTNAVRRPVRVREML